MKRFFVAFIFPLVSATFLAAQPSAPNPRSIPSTAYQVDVGGRLVFVEKFRDVNYAAFPLAAPAEISIHVTSPIKTCNISPHSAGIHGTTEGSTLRFHLERPRYLVVTINDGEKLFLFADVPDPAAPKTGQHGVVSVLDFGVDPTGARVDTVRLQSAVDRVAADKGVLYFPRGVYLTGTLSLKTDSTLYLAEGARLLGSTRHEDYPVEPGFDEAEIRWDPDLWLKQGFDVAYRQLIRIDGARNVRIAGPGTIEGQGRILLGGATGRLIAGIGNKNAPKIAGPQPVNIHLIAVRRSSGVTVEGVTLLDSPMYNAHVVGADHVTFRNVKIVSDPNVVNTDGIDPDSSRDVLIDHCFFYDADDCVSVKTSGQSRVKGDSERITVRRSVFLTRTSAVKLGTEMYVGGQRDIVFEDNDVLETGRAINISNEGPWGFERIRFTGFRIERFAWHKLQFPVHIHVETRHPDNAAGWIHDVTLEDIAVEVEPPADSQIAGLRPGHDVRGIRFVNYSIAGRIRVNADDAHVTIGPFVSDVTFTRK